MSHKVTLITGNHGASTALADAVRKVVDAAGANISWDLVGLNDNNVTDEIVDGVRANGAALMPFVRGMRDAGAPAPIVQLRRALGVFANVRPLHSVVGLNDRFPDVDVVIVRETTEDVYASLEHESIPGVFESLKVTTEAACRRIATYAFEQAREKGRSKVTTVHKSNIMKQSDGMFLRVAQEVSESYPDIEHDERIVDALCMQLVMYPERFDVLLCANLFGDIVADLAAGLVGGVSNCPSVNVAEDGTRVYTAGFGTNDDEANSDRGNPLGLLFAAVLLLRDQGEVDAADRLMNALRESIEAGERPLAAGGELPLRAFADRIEERLNA